MNSELAKQKALEHLVEEYRQSIRIERTELPYSVYDFHAEGWAIFSVSDNEPCVGGSEYIAVHLETGEARSLGMLGE